MKQIEFVERLVRSREKLTPANLDGKIKMDDGRLISFGSIDRHCRTLRRQGILRTEYKRGIATFYFVPPSKQKRTQEFGFNF